MSRLAGWLTSRHIAKERALVADPQGARRLLVRDLLLAALGLGALVGEDFLPSPWDVVAGFVVALMLGFCLMAGFRRALTYKSGWLDGRSAMIHAMVEAMDRGMTLDEWLDGEMTRDFAIMGVSPPSWGQEEGHGP